MKVCDICGQPSAYNANVTTESHTAKNVDLCPKCYKTHYQKEQSHKYLAYKETVEEMRDNDKHVNLNDKLNELSIHSAISDRVFMSTVGGSKFTINDSVFYVDKHFGWFGKLILKLFFGIKVEDHYYNLKT